MFRDDITSQESFMLSNILLYSIPHLKKAIKNNKNMGIMEAFIFLCATIVFITFSLVHRF